MAKKVRELDFMDEMKINQPIKNNLKLMCRSKGFIEKAKTLGVKFGMLVLITKHYSNMGDGFYHTSNNHAIAKELNVSVDVIIKNLSKMVKEGTLERICNGCYKLNTDFIRIIL